MAFVAVFTLYILLQHNLTNAATPQIQLDQNEGLKVIEATYDRCMTGKGRIPLRMNEWIEIPLGRGVREIEEESTESS